MIKLVYVPIRFSTEGVVSEFIKHEKGKSYTRYIEEFSKLPEGLDLKKCSVIDAGAVIEILDGEPEAMTTIVITPKIEWFAIVALGKAIWAYGIAHPYIFWATVVSLSYSVYSALTTKPRTPTFGGIGSGLDESSPTYGWEGIKQTCEPGIPVSIPYGEHRVGGNVINEYIRTDGDKNYYHCLTALGEGEIESIDEGMINKNPIANFSGVTITKRYGTNAQTVIPNFEDLHNLSAAINVELLKNDPYTYTTVDSDVEAFEIHLSLSSGLWQQNSETGQLSAWAVTYRVEYKLAADPVYTDLGTTTISTKNRSTVRRVFKKAGLTAGQYNIRITRTSNDSDDYHTGIMYLQYFDEIKCDDLSYPNTALVAVEALATNELSSSAPNITWVRKGRKVSIPAVLLGSVVQVWDDYYYDPDSSKFKLLVDDTELTWDAVTYVDAYSANPIWCCRDLVLATRYGLGGFIDSDVFANNARLLEMALYCEEKIQNGEGGYEKRHRLDVEIDSLTAALDLITQLSASFNAFPYYSEGLVGLLVDKPITLPSQEFGMGNVKGFSQNWKSLNEVPNVIEVTFNDKDKAYEQDTVMITDEDALAAGDPVRPLKIRVFCTRVSQAIRAGRYALYVAKYIVRTISFKASIDAILCQVGDRFNFSHDVPQWGFSGRLETGSTTTVLNLDRDVTIEAGKTYVVEVRHGADVIESRTVITAPSTCSSVEVSVAYSSAPEADAVFSFGEETIATKAFRLISLERLSTDEVELVGIEYDSRVYSNVDTDVTLPDTNYSALTFDTPVVTDLTLTERLVKLGDGTIENCIDIWFTLPSMSGKYIWAYERAKIYLSDDGGASWIYQGETTGSSYTIQQGLRDSITYQVAIISSSKIGGDKRIADSPSSSITIVGKSAAPSDVTGFVVRQSRDRLFYTWTDITDIDKAGYEIRFGTSWGSGELVAGSIKQNLLNSFLIQIGTDQSFWIKSLDTSGNYSTNATEGLVTVENVPFTNLIETYSEQTAWGGDKVNLDKVGDNLAFDTASSSPSASPSASASPSESASSSPSGTASASASVSESASASPSASPSPGTYLTGTYVTPIRDVGYVASFKIGVEAVATVSGDDTFQDFGDMTFDEMEEAMRFSGSELPGALSFEIKHSESESDLSDASWEDWYAGDYTCRYFSLRMTMTRTSYSQDLVCTQFDYYADLPDVDDFGTGEVTVAADGIEIVFNKEYHVAPSVNINILTGDGFLWKFSVVPDLTDCTIKLYDTSAVVKTGTFRWDSHGV